MCRDKESVSKTRGGPARCYGSCRVSEKRLYIGRIIRGEDSSIDDAEGEADPDESTGESERAEDEEDEDSIAQCECEDLECKELSKPEVEAASSNPTAGLYKRVDAAFHVRCPAYKGQKLGAHTPKKVIAAWKLVLEQVKKM